MGEETVSVAQPLLALAIVGRAAEAIGARVCLTWQGAEAVCGPDGVALNAAAAALCEEAVVTISLAKTAPQLRSLLRPRQTHARTVDPCTWAMLDAYAHKTYAPATEASRRAGAGGGTSDDD